MMTSMILPILFGFLFCIIAGEIGIPMLQKLKYGQQVRDDGPQSHLKKSGTPTMGGVIFLLGIVAIWLVFAPTNLYMIGCVFSTLSFGIVGFLDDYIKVVKKRSLGLNPKQKIACSLAFAVIMGIIASINAGTKVWIPFINVYLNFGILFVPFAVFFVIAVTNSVNLTDGLDGLASAVMVVICITYAIIYYLMYRAGEISFADARGIIVFACGLCGCLLGFLRFNIHPARVFMGDTGSLALGGALSFMALMSNSMFLIPIVGACFLVSAVSVILQVGSYKLRNGKRIFKMAPLHHHFELCGVKETKIVSMYTIVTVIFCLVGLLAYAL